MEPAEAMEPAGGGASGQWSQRRGGGILFGVVIESDEVYLAEGKGVFRSASR